MANTAIAKLFRKAAKPKLDWSAGFVEWELTLPPHGTNHTKELAQWAAKPHMYKVTESKLWDAGVSGVTGGWYPPPRTSLTIEMTLFVPYEQIRKLDCGKWGAVVEDAVVGARNDQWIDTFICHKQAVIGEGKVTVRVSWKVPEPRGRRVKG